MSQKLSRLQEVLRDLLAYHPAVRIGGVDQIQPYVQIFCDAMLRAGDGLRSVKAHFDQDDAVFLINVDRAQLFSVYDSLRFGMRAFFLSSDYGVNEDNCLVMYRVRGARPYCARQGLACQNLSFGYELLLPAA